jgi:ArsR family transcriptional regulator, arsenate/arsenite/antimonite-responsive transcriptional repressor
MDTTTTPRERLLGTSQRTEPCCESAEQLVSSALDTTQPTRLAERLRALADPTRLRMLDLLVEQSRPLCVCDITAQFDQHQPTISHHLRLLRQAGLIDGEKRGVWSYYWATEAGKRSVVLLKTLL